MDLRSCFAAQVLASAMTILLLMAVWRRSTVPYALKAAAAACGVLFATPYAYIYDHVVLAVALAFLVRHGLETRTGFLERSGIAAACGLILLFPFVAAPVGLAAQLLVAIMVAGRLNQCRGEKELGLPKVPALALAEPDRPR
jgi:arabinofuranan 3-O-arabinosyltransferase